MKMKVLLKIFAMAAVTVLLQSCIDDTIGASLIDTRNSIINDSAFVITGRSVENKRLQARTSTQLLGLIKSDGYGTLSSQVLTQFMPSSSIDTVDVTEDLIDSCRLVLRIASGGFTGDQIVPMRLSVYRLSKALEAPLFSDIDPTDYYDKNNLLGEAPYSPQSATTVYLNSSDLKAYKETCMCLCRLNWRETCLLNLSATRKCLHRRRPLHNISPECLLPTASGADE